MVRVCVYGEMERVFSFLGSVPTLRFLGCTAGKRDRVKKRASSSTSFLLSHAISSFQLQFYLDDLFTMPKANKRKGQS